jgi:hypothetical protein
VPALWRIDHEKEDPVENHIHTTPALLRAAADWTRDRPPAPNITLRTDGRRLVVAQGDAWASIAPSDSVGDSNSVTASPPADPPVARDEQAVQRRCRRAWLRIAEILREIEDRIASQTSGGPLSDVDDDALAERETAAWSRVDAWRNAVELVMLERIARLVRTHIPDAVALRLEPTDQGGRGWVLAPDPAVLSDGSTLDGADARVDALADEDELNRLLSDLGECINSDTEPAPYRLELPSEQP